MSLLKRIAAATAAVVLALSCVLGSVSAAEQEGLSVGFELSSEGFTLSLVSLPQTAQDRYITCVRFKLRYDHSVYTVAGDSGYSVTPLSTDFPAGIEDRLILVSSEPGVVEFCYIDWATVENILKGTGEKHTLFAAGQSVTIPFIVTPGADLTQPHEFEVFDVRYGIDADIESSQLIAGNGVKVTVDGKPQYERGDINRDGKIDSDDAMFLLRHVLFPNEYVIESPLDVADFVADGKIDSNDAIYLLRHVLFPADYPLN